MGIYNDIVINVRIPEDDAVRYQVYMVLNKRFGESVLRGSDDFSVLTSRRTTGQEDPTPDYLELMVDLKKAGARSGYIMIITEELPTTKIDLHDGVIQVFNITGIELILNDVYMEDLEGGE